MKGTMYRYSSLKQIYGVLSELIHCKTVYRHKVNKISDNVDQANQTSEFYVTESQIHNDISTDGEAPSPPILECCEEGCQNCVWLEYVIKLKYYTKNDQEKIKEALTLIPNKDVKAFVEFELRKKD